MSGLASGRAPSEPVVSENRRRQKPLVTIGLLVGSVAFVMNAAVAVHELGHLLADRLAGLDASVVLDPFGPSFVEIQGSVAGEIPIWAIAAGPVSNVVVGVVLLALCWPMRSPYVFPFLLWAPMALLQESATALVQMVGREPGTDFVLIAQAGAGTGVIVAGGVVGALAGLWLLMLLLPVAGIAPQPPWAARAAVLAVGLGGYPLVALSVAAAAGHTSQAIGRNARVLAFTAIIAVVLATLYPSVMRRLDDPVEVPTSAAIWAIGIGVVMTAGLWVI